ncbi:MAG: Na+/H+ antiporter NhaA [Labilithrix sp.]|nr:Na+/H+ antiporter NhaA [Labilithrix sp.]MCW5815656.1 Na+/H+ antiporter NhaA [Labilithrix sp.]
MGPRQHVEHDLPVPPEASPAARRWLQRLVSPIESFLRIQAASGVVLLAAAIAAIAAANSSWAGAYHHLVDLPLGVRAGALNVERPLHFWVNDGLMTVFFFVVGLEIRREIHEGELATWRRAALPIVAAAGGMLAPALFYTAIAAAHPEARRGWGVPMATDIAFAVGVLALLGKRVPPALRVLLLALAIIDDLGGIVVIALFYSSSLDVSGLAVLAAGTGAILTMQRLGIRRAFLYLPAGILVWDGFLRAGVHPSIAGVLVGMLTPVRPRLDAEGLVDLVRRSADHIESKLGGGRDHEALAHEASYLVLAQREALSPSLRLQRALHPWVAFGVMPLFAAVNAGVSIRGSSFSVVSAGIVAGLLAGKPLGILAACAIAVRTRLVALPRGVGWRELSVLGLIAGIGFTISLFVATLAFPSETELASAKTGILVASVLAMVLGLAGGRVLLRGPMRGAAESESEAEGADDV